MPTDHERMLIDAADAMERFHGIMGELLDDINANGVPPSGYGAVFSSWSYLIGDRMNRLHSAVKADNYKTQ